MKIKFYKIICLFVLVLGLVFSEASVAEAKSPVGISSTEEWEVLKLVNQERTSRGMVPLSLIGSLQTANNIRAAELCKVFSHTRPEGSSCFTALRGVNYQAAGENIAVGYATPGEVMDAWMNSPGHKGNILNGSFTHIGVGYYYNGDGSYRHYWSQMFIGTCSPVSISVEGSRAKSYPYGTKIGDMNRVLRVRCVHGISYLPLTDSMCSGYNGNTTGTKKVKVKYQGKSTSFVTKVHDYL